jgi:hypothetical protein
MTTLYRRPAVGVPGGVQGPDKPGAEAPRRCRVGDGGRRHTHASHAPSRRPARSRPGGAGPCSTTLVGSWALAGAGGGGSGLDSRGGEGTEDGH